MAKLRGRQRLGIEVGFLVPVREDRNLGSGRRQPADRWEWLSARLRERFGGFSASRATVMGFYRDPDTRRPVQDDSRAYTLALKRADVAELRRILGREVAPRFVQKCIYLAVGVDVELVFNAEL
ncbi:MAG TPA: hypothetical protein VGM03_07405 [Phycisphaerae bacterium]|jgi:hypothetical protein